MILGESSEALSPEFVQCLKQPEIKLNPVDTIISFAIAHAIREHPEVVQAEILTLMRRQAELEEENQELRRRVTCIPVSRIIHGGR